MRLRELHQRQPARAGRAGSEARAHRRGRGQGMARVIAFVALALVASVCQAQTYPQRAVRMIVPFAPGGTTDALGRVLAHSLGEKLGQQVVVENRPGGGGTLGAEAGAGAAPGGYTTLLGSAEGFRVLARPRARPADIPGEGRVPRVR